MFKSATIRLTAWYVAILAAICLLFSSAIFIIAQHEVNARLSHFDNGLQILRAPDSSSSVAFNYDDTLLGDESSLASSHLIWELLWCNLAILILGGIGAFYLARHTMEPIERAHEAQSRFTSDASHELRTPLASMQLELESILRDKDADAAMLRDTLESSLEEVTKMSALSGLLLNLSHLEYKELEMSKFDISGLVRDTIQHARESHRITLKSPKKLQVSGNKIALGEVLAILIDNAVKYSTPDSIIRVRLTQKGRGMAAISVTNDGPGIQANDISHIFERFYRGDSSRSSNTVRGFGLGLSLAQKIVELHHGTIAVTSKPGKITTFTVTLQSLRARESS